MFFDKLKQNSKNKMDYSAATWIAILFLIFIVVVGVLVLLPGDLSVLTAEQLAAYSTSKDWYGGLAIAFAIVVGIAVFFIKQ